MTKQQITNTQPAIAEIRNIRRSDWKRLPNTLKRFTDGTARVLSAGVYVQVRIV